MQGKVAIVTGANTGLGLETARGLLAQGAHVVLACRDLAKAEAARAELVASTGRDEATALRLDLASRARIEGFVASFEERFERLDVLVDNAGVWHRTRRKTVDGFEATFGVNHLGTFLVTHLLRPTLERSAPARVVVLTSSLYAGSGSGAGAGAELDWDDLEFKRRPYQGAAAYGQSKRLNLLFALALARRLEGRGVTVNAVHPGVVATELTREAPRRGPPPRGQLTAAQGAAAVLALASSPTLAGVTGRYFELSAEVSPAPAAVELSAQERLWALSLEVLGLPPEA
jgi:NAD(P)-dependent dehydrogenase (short-subunit alcohol dehydrogenase family)